MAEFKVDFSKLLAGEQLDHFVGDRVMGWEKIDSFGIWFDAEGKPKVCFGRFAPSNNYDSAFAVVDRLRELGWRVYIEDHFYDAPRFDHKEKPERWQVDLLRLDGMYARCRAETLPLAICRAALQAMEKKQKSEQP